MSSAKFISVPPEAAGFSQEGITHKIVLAA
jgi:hypothetical protein